QFIAQCELFLLSFARYAHKKTKNQNPLKTVIQSLRALGQFVPKPILNKRERMRYELQAQQISSSDLAAEQDNRDLNQEENPISYQSQLRERRENRQKHSDLFWKIKHPDQQILNRTIILKIRISDYACRTEEQNSIYYHDKTIEEKIIQTKKEISALVSENKHRRYYLVKENEIRTLKNERIDLIRTLRNDQIDSNPTIQLDRLNPQSPRLPNYIEQAIALEVDERLPLPNYKQDPPTVITPNTVEIAGVRIKRRTNQPSSTVVPENPIQSNSPQVQYQIIEVDPLEEEDLDKQILQLQEERDMIQMKFELEVHDTIFGEFDCLSDLNNNELNKQSQSEDSEEAKDPLSIQGDKKKHTTMDQQNENENSAKAKVSLIKKKQKKIHKEMDQQSQSDDFQQVGTTRVKKKRGRHKRVKKIKVLQPRKEKKLNNMNEDQTRNLRSGTKLLQSKPEYQTTRPCVQSSFLLAVQASNSPFFGYEWNEVVEWRTIKFETSDSRQIDAQHPK
ncbi:MAG: hypothetical protein EZS28_017361, partial [Streblomastix strix]